MTTKAERRWDVPDCTGKRLWNIDSDDELLKILRLDLHTIIAQIKILEHELAGDPCLCSEGVATILSLVDALKQELEGVRLRIRELKESTAVQCT